MTLPSNKFGYCKRRRNPTWSTALVHRVRWNWADVEVKSKATRRPIFIVKQASWYLGVAYIATKERLIHPITRHSFPKIMRTRHAAAYQGRAISHSSVSPIGKWYPPPWIPLFLVMYLRNETNLIWTWIDQDHSCVICIPLIWNCAMVPVFWHIIMFFY